jgi:transcriptional regulator with XRE-family HTH domain
MQKERILPRKRIEGDKEFGQWMRRQRKAAKLTQEQVAAMTRSTVATIRRYEQGKASPRETWMQVWRGIFERPPSQTRAVRQATSWSPEDEISFIKILRASATETLRFGGIDLRTTLLPTSLWNVDRRKHHLFVDDPEERYRRIEVEWVPSVLPADLLKRLMDEIDEQRRLYKAGLLAITDKEIEDIEEVHDRLKRDRSNPYPRLVALPEPVGTDRGTVFQLRIGEGKYGVSLITEKNLGLPSATEFRARHVLHSLALRVAYVFESLDGKRWVECHQREARGNATWKGAWDIGAAGYVDPLRHKDPRDPHRISPWQACCDELEKELNIDGYELPHRDHYYFFGLAHDQPTGHIILLAYCHAQHPLKPDRPLAPLVQEYASCELTPEAVANFIAKKRRWVPSAILTFILTLEAFGCSKKEIEKVFAKRLPGNLDLSP